METKLKQELEEKKYNGTTASVGGTENTEINVNDTGCEIEEGKKEQNVISKEENKPKICRHWASNRCKRGNSCKFGHPQLCEQFCRLGPLCESNMKGCDRKCGLFHPRNIWCH